MIEVAALRNAKNARYATLSTRSRAISTPINAWKLAFETESHESSDRCVWVQCAITFDFEHFVVLYIQRWSWHRKATPSSIRVINLICIIQSLTFEAQTLPREVLQFGLVWFGKAIQFCHFILFRAIKIIDNSKIPWMKRTKKRCASEWLRARELYYRYQAIHTNKSLQIAKRKWKISQHTESAARYAERKRRNEDDIEEWELPANFSRYGYTLCVVHVVHVHCAGERTEWQYSVGLKITVWINGRW